MKYEKIIHEGKVVCIFEPSIGAIPLDLANSDYQAYLASLEQPETSEDTL
jgi:hypothetical protein